MGVAPIKCPMCGEIDKWKLIDTKNKGFSAGKATVGTILLGPIGLVGGALGKNKNAIAAGNVVFSMSIELLQRERNLSA